MSTFPCYLLKYYVHATSSSYKSPRPFAAQRQTTTCIQDKLTPCFCAPRKCQMRKKECRPMRCVPRWSIAGRSALRKKNNPKPAGAISARHREVCVYMEANNFSSYIFSDHASPTFQSFQPPAVQRIRHTTLLLHSGRHVARQPFLIHHLLFLHLHQIRLDHRALSATVAL
jgi:hypothetical protein